ncbi:hypothetical protein RF11_01722 [Thelohanellus kitauei]|uniref:Uncharacterized protein n=1 Tax=Thelohanellus kitauei TaxID=669202 RepID=A0A0C2ND53_THEKT|nr:hypothetical protein RF11_01722 [Thelohanellus kitauei]
MRRFRPTFIGYGIIYRHVGSAILLGRKIRPYFEKDCSLDEISQYFLSMMANNSTLSMRMKSLIGKFLSRIRPIENGMLSCGRSLIAVDSNKSLTLERVLSIAGSMPIPSKTMKAIKMEDTEFTKDCRHFSRICSRCYKLEDIKVVCMTKLPINSFLKCNSKYRSSDSINELVVNSCEFISISIGVENLHFPSLVDTGAS